MLGILARDGRGTPIDYADAYFHFRLAVLQGGAEAERVMKHDVERMAEKIGDEDRRTKVAASDEWFTHHSLKLVYIYKNKRASDFPGAAITYASDGTFAGQLVPLSTS